MWLDILRCPGVPHWAAARNIYTMSGDIRKMTEKLIDWHEPLCAVNNSSSIWEVLQTDGERRWCFEVEHPQTAYMFLSDGVCASDDVVIKLENIRQEREGGYYVVRCTKPFNYTLLYYHNGGWLTHNCGQKTDAPVEVVSRFFWPEEYRPADKFPPPMDGGEFELMSCKGESEVWYFIEHQGEACWENVLGQKRRCAWILDKHWRPVQTTK